MGSMSPYIAAIWIPWLLKIVIFHGELFNNQRVNHLFLWIIFHRFWLVGWGNAGEMVGKWLGKWLEDG